nr:MAG TPA: hypothetical protein [Caudoviricetes sp.]
MNSSLFSSNELQKTHNDIRLRLTQLSIGYA